MRTVLVITIWAYIAGCSVSPEEVGTNPTIITMSENPPTAAKYLMLYEDDEMRVIGVGYGDHHSPHIPGFYIFGKSNHRWVKVEKVSLKHATLGRSPTFDECHVVGKHPPSVGWDLRHLRGRDYIDLPLTSSGSLLFPDRIEKNELAGCLVLRFGSQWQIPRVETVLMIALGDLRRALAQ